MFFFPLFDNNPTKDRPIISWIIIFLCIIVYMWQITLSDFEQKLIFLKFGIIPSTLFGISSLPSDIYSISPILTIFTSMFLHGSIMHLLSNMLYMWIFSDNIEDQIGKVKFIIFYFLCGFFAALTQSLIDPESNIPMIGASGGIAGILGAYIILFPKAYVRVFLLILIFIRIVSFPAWLVLGFWILGEFISAPINLSSDGGVAYFAHIGGFISGVILIYFFKEKNVSSVVNLKKNKKNIMTQPITFNDLKNEAKLRYKSYVPSVRKKRKNIN